MSGAEAAVTSIASAEGPVAWLPTARDEAREESGGRHRYDPAPARRSKRMRCMGSEWTSHKDEVLAETLRS